MSVYVVVVSNIGTVYTGTQRELAESTFNHYVIESNGKIGRASGESVTLMKDNEIVREHDGVVND